MRQPASQTCLAALRDFSRSLVDIYKEGGHKIGTRRNVLQDTCDVMAERRKGGGEADRSIEIDTVPRAAADREN
jgi:hypothetical protein